MDLLRTIVGIREQHTKAVGFRWDRLAFLGLALATWIVIVLALVTVRFR